MFLARTRSSYQCTTQISHVYYLYAFSAVTVLFYGGKKMRKRNSSPLDISWLSRARAKLSSLLLIAEKQPNTTKFPERKDIESYFLPQLSHE